MNEGQRAAFELKIGEVRRLIAKGPGLEGMLLGTCSAHEPDPNLQRDLIRMLADAGADINETDKNGVTPLHRAATNTGAPATVGTAEAAREIAAVLIAHGADLSLRNSKGKRAIDHVMKDEKLRSLLG